jgi:predicted porin
MKKHLIAAAVATAIAAPAMAQVTVYGVLSSGYQSLDAKDGADVVETTTTGQQGLQAGSRLGFRGTEDLGGGNKAGFVYERGISMSTATDSIRQAFVSLSGAFGEVRLGRGNSLSKDLYDGFHAHGGSGFAPGNQSAALSLLLSNDFELAAYGNVRHSSMVSYISPSMAGVTARLQYAQEKTTDNGTTASGKVQNIGLNYAAGPLSLALAHDVSKVTAGAASAKLTTDMIGGSYDAGVARLFAAHTKVKAAEAAVELKVTDNSIGVNVPVGSINLIASVSDGDLKVPGVKVNTDGYQLGLNYNLSKRTMILGRYGESKAKVTGASAKLEGVLNFV